MKQLVFNFACGVGCYTSHENSFVQLGFSSNQFGSGTPKQFKISLSSSLTLTLLLLSSTSLRDKVIYSRAVFRIHCHITETLSNVRL